MKLDRYSFSYFLSTSEVGGNYCVCAEKIGFFCITKIVVKLSVVKKGICRYVNPRSVGVSKLYSVG